MEEEELLALEADLDAVGQGLATDRPYRPGRWKMNWALWRPAWRLIWAGLIVALGLLPIGGGPHWMMSIALALTLLPFRFSKFRERREELALAGEDELFALYKEQVGRETMRLLFAFGIDLAIALTALLFLWASPHSQLAQLGVLIFGVSTLFTALVSIPRSSRERRALETPEERAEREHESAEEEEDDGPLWLMLLGLAWSLARAFVLYVGPIIVLLSALIARFASNPKRLWTLAIVLSALWVVQFIYIWFIADQDEEEEEES